MICSTHGQHVGFDVARGAHPAGGLVLAAEVVQHVADQVGTPRVVAPRVWVGPGHGERVASGVDDDGLWRGRGHGGEVGATPGLGRAGHHGQPRRPRGRPRRGLGSARVLPRVRLLQVCNRGEDGVKDTLTLAMSRNAWSEDGDWRHLLLMDRLPLLDMATRLPDGEKGWPSLSQLMWGAASLPGGGAAWHGSTATPSTGIVRFPGPSWISGGGACCSGNTCTSRMGVNSTVYRSRLGDACASPGVGIALRARTSRSARSVADPATLSAEHTK